jgi:hypothetical protein
MKASKQDRNVDVKESEGQPPDGEDRVVTQVPGIDSSQVIPSQPMWFNGWTFKPGKKRPYSDYEKMRSGRA